MWISYEVYRPSSFSFFMDSFADLESFLGIATRMWTKMSPRPFPHVRGRDTFTFYLQNVAGVYSLGNIQS